MHAFCNSARVYSSSVEILEWMRADLGRESSISPFRGRARESDGERVEEPVATNHSQQIVQKLWNYCNVLRDDGLSYGDYVE